MDTVSVVIPAYNEEGSVRSVVAEIEEILLQHKITPEIIVVDDGSKDQTAQSAAEAGARVLRHRSNRGYGAALKTGIASASREHVVITADPPPREIGAEYLGELHDARQNPRPE